MLFRYLLGRIPTRRGMVRADAGLVQNDAEVIDFNGGSGLTHGGQAYQLRIGLRHPPLWQGLELASTPPRSFSLPVACNGKNLTCAAFGSIAAGAHSVHIVNNGAERKATVTGIPGSIKQLKMWATDAAHGMQECGPIQVSAGKAELSLGATAYTTLNGMQQPVSQAAIYLAGPFPFRRTRAEPDWPGS